MSAQLILFLLFSFAAVVTAILVVLQANPVRSALFLVLNLFCVAVLFLLLNAWFLAAVQVLVYAGAIMVLFLFVIMLLNLGSPDRAEDPLKPQQPLAVLGGAVLALILGGWVLSGVRPPAMLDTDAVRRQAEQIGTVESIGVNLFDPAQPWLFPFEMTSVLLLVAVIGSVVLAKRRM